MSTDPTGIKIAFDPTIQRMTGVTAHGFMPFDVPFITEIAPNLWQGGCKKGLILPRFIKHVVSLYPWEAYKTKHEVTSTLTVRMHDAEDQDTGVVDELARWVTHCRTTGPVLVHCFPPGTLVGAPIPTPIEDAEEVFGHDGRLHKVTAHHARTFAGDLIVLRMHGALPLRCTPEHPVQVVRPYRFPGGFMAKPSVKSLADVRTVFDHYAEQPVWLRADQVEAGDFLISPRLTGRSEARPVPWPTTGHSNLRAVGDLIPDRDTAWMLGLYAADGGTQGRYTIGFTLAPADDADRLAAVWRSMGLEPNIRKYPTYTKVTINSRTVRDAMSAWCGSKENKRLPDFVFRDNWPLDAVVEGYAVGDGYTNRRGAIVCRCISPTLVEQIRTALVACGESPTVAQVNRATGFANAKPIYEVNWNPNATQRRTTWWRDQYLVPVKAVEREPYSGPVYNLAVADAETFTVNGLITHNCQAGLNRSSLVTARVLMMDGATADEAIRVIREKRSAACLCNEAFEEWLRSLPQPEAEAS